MRRDDDPASVVDAGPDPTTTSVPEAKTDDPPGAVAVVDADIVLEPAGPYADRQEVVLAAPAPHAESLLHQGGRLGAVVADDPVGPTERCDPRRLVVEPRDGSSLFVTVDQQVLTPTGLRDCNEAAATLAVTRADPDGTFVLDPDGLVPHPSWTALQADDPTRAAGFPPFHVVVCAFDSSSVDVAPYGADLWGFSGAMTLLPPSNCANLPVAATLEAEVANAPFSLVVPRRLVG